MTASSRIWHARRALLILAAAAALVIAGLLGGGSTPSRAATEEPCDIYAAADTPCVAAHSTTRALYAAYDGPLYQVERASDDTTTDVYPVSAGGVADSATQDSFCAQTYCWITEIFDQSGHGNNLTDAPAGGSATGPDILANAAAAPVTVDGSKVYGVNISLGMGYRDDSTTDIATGNASEGEYAVLDGTHYDNECCFDYGNAETNNDDDGDGTMEAINFGDETTWGYGTGDGPWIMADMENGLFSGENAGYNSGDPSTDYRFTTAMLEGGQNQWALLGGNAQSGSLATDYSGARPSGYTTMDKQGAIILGIGGDNSDNSAGTFYEGVMTSGYPTAATEAAVQANIVAAGYSTYTLPGNPFTGGSEISLNATTPCCTGDYLVGDTSGDGVGVEAVTSSSSTALKEDATWIVEPGLANSSCVSFESANGSGDYLRHYAFELYLEPNDGTTQFALDATFCPRAGNSGSNYSFMSYNYSYKYIRHYDYVGYVASDGVFSSNAWDAASLWDEDSTWAVTSPWS
jgi:non-reducing end alpha-L-arabinofuranosidase